MPKVLAYDPNPEASWQVLTDLGHEVVSFNDPGETLDYATENKVDIAILSAPEGVDLIKHLRKLSANFKVVLLCESPNLLDIRRALRWAPCSYLFKPIVSEEIDQCLKRALLKGKSSIKTALNL